MTRLSIGIGILFFTPLVGLTQDWPQFRGPEGQGHADVRSLPLRWSDQSDNITWKMPIDGLGWSSPVVHGERVWLTTALDEGRSLRAICLHLMSGREIHDVEVFQKPQPGNVHRKNSHASPTPFIEGDRVYVHFGAHGTACLSRDGKVIWRRVLKYNHVHGPGGSPVVFEDLLIINCDGGDVQFVVALDKQTGETRWQTSRPKNTSLKQFAFSTPLLVEIDGETRLISAGANNVCAYEPQTGRQIWQVSYPDGYSVVPRPVYGHGMFFVSTGYDSPSLVAIRAGGRGDVTDTNVEWTLTRGAPLNPSPLLVGDELYIVSDGGVASCLDAKTGELHWQHRMGGTFSASPLYAAGRIYLLDEDGTTTVIAPSKEYQELAQNKVTGRTLASLTPIEGALLLRTDTHLYRIESERE